MATGRICSVDGCGKHEIARGWCTSHYNRWRTHGDPLAGRIAPDPNRKCSVEGCGRPYAANGYCSRHMQRHNKYGDPLAGRPPRAEFGEPQRFIDEVAIPFAKDDCLAWPFARSKGYAKINDGGKYRWVSRIICERVHGSPPDSGYQAAHNCGRGHEGCVNPRHLRWATPKENAADKEAHGTQARGERQGSSKLTAANVREIRALAGQLSYAEIGRRFGVNWTQARRIIRGEQWGWLE